VPFRPGAEPGVAVAPRVGVGELSKGSGALPRGERSKGGRECAQTASGSPTDPGPLQRGAATVPGQPQDKTRTRDRVSAAGTLNNIGLIYADTGRYAEALRQFQDSLKIARELKDRAREAQSFDNIGIVYGRMGRFMEAFQQYQDGLNIKRELKDRAGEALTLHNIGIVYEAIGQNAEALQQYQDNLKIVRELKTARGRRQSSPTSGSSTRTRVSTWRRCSSSRTASRSNAS